MSWYDKSGMETDVFVSSRVRLARNIDGYPFEGRLTSDMAKEIIEKITALFPADKGYTSLDMQTQSPAEAASLCEKHYISDEFSAKRTPHTLITDDQTGLSVMVCEEDHLRIQCLRPGFDISGCAEAAFAAEQTISENLPIAFSEKLGYLTHCPTNLGTGMRVSVMMFLPALTAQRRMESLSAQLQKVGLVIRGMQGEGSKPAAYLYQISNQITLGISEEKTIQKVTDMVRQIADLERRARNSADGVTRLAIADRAARAEGILRCCRRISTEEFFSLWSDLRLGVCIGEISGLNTDKLDRMLFEVMPATMALMSKDTSPAYPAEVRRDITRAATIRRILAYDK